jgi:hypothetical protein
VSGRTAVGDSMAGSSGSVGVAMHWACTRRRRPIPALMVTAVSRGPTESRVSAKGFVCGDSHLRALAEVGGLRIELLTNA